MHVADKIMAEGDNAQNKLPKVDLKQNANTSSKNGYNKSLSPN